MDEIYRKIHVDHENCRRQLPFAEYSLDSDGVGAFVFKRKGKIVRAEKHYGVHGDFEEEFTQSLKKGSMCISGKAK